MITSIEFEDCCCCYASSFDACDSVSNSCDMDSCDLDACEPCPHMIPSYPSSSSFCEESLVYGENDNDCPPESSSLLLSATTEDHIRTEVTTSFASKSNSAAVTKSKRKSWGVSASSTMVVRAGLLAVIACQSTLTVVAAQGTHPDRRNYGYEINFYGCQASMVEEYNYNVAFHIVGILIILVASAVGIMGTAAMAFFKFTKEASNVSTVLQVCLLFFFKFMLPS
jgi:hypothetical protein